MAHQAAFLGKGMLLPPLHMLEVHRPVHPCLRVELMVPEIFRARVRATRPPLLTMTCQTRATQSWLPLHRPAAGLSGARCDAHRQSAKAAASVAKTIKRGGSPLRQSHRRVCR
jgi:hypothetical protein